MCENSKKELPDQFHNVIIFLQIYTSYTSTTSQIITYIYINYYKLWNKYILPTVSTTQYTGYIRDILQYLE